MGEKIKVFEPINEYESKTNQNMNDYDVYSLGDKNPAIHSPSAPYDIYFYQTKATLSDPEVYRNFIKNAETRFRRSPDYKIYKAYLMGLGFDHCQIMGDIESEDGVEIELHHNIFTLFDDCILICEHVLNTVGYISSFDLIQLLINEHRANRIPCCFLSVTAHQMFTNDPEAYIPPDMTFGKWWELLSKYRYGITYDIANKVNKYINKYQNQLPTTIQILPQEQILNFAYYNEFGANVSPMDLIPYKNANEIETDTGGNLYIEDKSNSVY
jgi:hypothetical protein